jgi:hypothetical protein
VADESNEHRIGFCWITPVDFSVPCFVPGHDAMFIRFVGHCKPDEAAEMANVIAAYRRSSDAFVITNAVKVGEDTEGAELELASLEAINKFNVMDALKEYLSVEDVKILESLNA